MISRHKNLFFGLALLLSLPQWGAPQNAQDVGTVLRNAASRVPELSSIAVRQPPIPNQNIWTAISSSVNVTLEVTTSPKAAEWKLVQSLRATSVSHDRKDVFNGRTLYIWQRYGSRLSYQVGPYVIHVNGRGGRDTSQEPLAMKVLESIVRELESVAPRYQVRRAKDLAPDNALALSWGPQRDFFKERNFEVVSWEDARFILLDRALQGGKQYHTRWLTIFCSNGDTFLTLQPEIDAYAQWGKANSLNLTGFASE